MNRADLRVTSKREDGDTVMVVAGELDMSTADQLTDAVNEQLRDRPSRLVLDLADLSFCDSLGLGTLIVLSRAARGQETYLVLRNPSPFLSRMLDVTGVRDGLNIAPS
jgi:anti-sigma B factor antagonist